MSPLEYGMNVLEKMKLNGQLNGVYLEIVGVANVLEKMKLNGQINDIYLKLNAGGIDTPTIERDEKFIKSAVNKAIRAINAHKKASSEFDAATDKFNDESHLIFNDYGDIEDEKRHNQHQSKINSASAKATKANAKINQSYIEFRDAGGSNDEWNQKVLNGLDDDGWTGEELAEDTYYLTPAEIAEKEAEKSVERERRAELEKQRLAKDEAEKPARDARTQARNAIKLAIKAYVDGLGSDPRVTELNDWDVNFEKDDTDNITSGVQRFSIEDSENYTVDIDMFVTAAVDGSIVAVQVKDRDFNGDLHDISDYQSLTMTKLVDHVLSFSQEEKVDDGREYVDALNAMKALTIADFNTLSGTESKAKFYGLLDQQESIVMKLSELNLLDEHTPLILSVGEHVAILKAESVGL